jgi:hypothetical protein
MQLDFSVFHIYICNKTLSVPSGCKDIPKMPEGLSPLLHLHIESGFIRKKGRYGKANTEVFLSILGAGQSFYTLVCLLLSGDFDGNCKISLINKLLMQFPQIELKINIRKLD